MNPPSASADSSAPATAARDGIRTAHTCASDARRAVQEFHAAVAQPGATLVIFFCSVQYDLDVIAAEMARLFGETPVIGCSTAGEIGPGGYCQRSLCGVSFAEDVCTAVTGHLPALQGFGLKQGETFANGLLQQLEARAPTASRANTFGFLLIDGLSIREESVTHVLQHGLGGIPIFGGSAGDDMKFTGTFVYHRGRFHRDSAVMALATTTLPFQIFKTQHFVPTERRVVVTAADAAHRLVQEIDGFPAAEEYARLIGAAPGDLNPQRFAASPVVVLIDGTDYVRSIQKANPDGSLTFYCAIEEGLVLRVANGVGMVENLEQTFARLRREIGPPRLVIGCDCVLRRLESQQRGFSGRMEDILRQNHTVGFCCYGEQFGSVHVNQTFTGIAIGSGP